MSRPWILGIICLSLLASSVTTGVGQDYLDLPDDVVDQPSSLTDKFLSLKDKLRRKPRPTQEATQSANTTAQRRNPRAPRYRNTAQSSLQAQRARRQNASAQPQQQSQQQPRSGVVVRPKTSDLLPDAQLFSRGSKPLPPRQQSSQKAARQKTLTRAASVPRTGSTKRQQPTKQQTASQQAKSSPTQPRVARRSPATSRANELDAALADLLKAKPSKSLPQPVALESFQPSKRKLSKSVAAAKSAASATSHTFDLRKALLDDEEDSLAAEIAEAAAPVAEPKVETPTAKVVAGPTFAEKLIQKQVSAEAAPVAIAKPKVEEIKPPAVVATPKPEVRVPAASVATSEIAPTTTEPMVIEPKAIEPVVVAVPPKPVITIATPRPSPSVAGDSKPKFDDDPFESSSKQAFSTPQTSSNNPMRPFQPAVEQTETVKSIARPDRGVLQTTQQPVIVSHVEGPRSILVGHEASYQVTLENTSDTQATNLSVEVTVPEWAELVDAMSTSGVVTRSTDGANAGALEWKLSDLDKRSSQALRLRLIPRSGRPLQLGVRWSQAPMVTQAVVEVQEPKLELAISGPQEVLYGKSQRYRLTLRNPGTGLTEHVSLRLVPPGGDPTLATTQSIGNLKPGEVRDIDLELTAREAGELLIQANAVADGGLKADTTKTVLCLKPELKVDWRGPDKKYAGTEAAYYFRVSNPGTAETEPVDVSVKLPVGTEFISASEGYSINATTGIVSWRLGRVDVSDEQFMQLRCKIAKPGINNFEVTAKTNDGGLSDSNAFQTDVVALADLKLEVRDPQGPLPLGEAVVYEIRVKNRGTTSAENINIVGLFSEGIDPTTVEGAQYTLRDGRVSFHPIKSLPAGREVLLRIHAKAGQVGTHIFRTEVTCPELDIKLAAEETTRFFEDEHRWEDGQTPYTAERESNSQR